MELPTINNSVTTVGGLSRSTFGIAMNAKAFRVLSDTLYQNKIGSIVREISCNALDGHIANGNPDVPFTIHMPDAFEPWFSVRDYGIGLTPDAMVTVFTQYFESTKDQSNDSIGAFGLGAKTPFSYTDQFNVTSVTDGIMRAYSAFIDEAGMPSIDLMAEVPTEEPSGVEIKLGVKPEDFNRFREEIRTQLRFFPVKPEIVNYNGGKLFDEVNPATILFSNDDITIFNERPVYGQPPVNIVQGPVGYPLDFNQANKGLDKANVEFMGVISRLGANLLFDIGEIGVTASREGVEYNKITLANLNAKVTAAREAIEQWMQDSIQRFTTPYEKALFLNTHTVFASFLNSASVDVSPAVVKGNQYAFPYLTDAMFKEKFTYTDYAGVEREKDVASFEVVRYEYSPRADDSIGSTRIETGNEFFYPNDKRKIVFAIRDTAKAPVARMRHYFRENNLASLYSIVSRTGTEFTDDMLVKLREELGEYPEVIRVSDMPDPPRQSYARGSYVRPRAYIWGSTRVDLTSTSDWGRLYGKNLNELVDANENEIEGTALYVVAERQQINMDYLTQQRFNALANAGMVEHPLIAVRPSDVEKLGDMEMTWIKLEDYVEEKVKELKESINVRRYKVLSAIVEAVDNSIGHRFNVIADDLNPETDIARLLRVREKAVNKIGDASKVKSVMEIIKDNNLRVDETVAVKTVQTRASEVFNRTPLLAQYRNSWYNLPSDANALNHMVEYINIFGRRGATPIDSEKFDL